MKDFTDKTIVITGAGSGLGRALALAFAREGARLALADVSQPGLTETSRQAAAAGCSVVNPYLVDVADRARVERFAEEVAHDLGGADLLVNNAGVSSSGCVEDLRYETIEWTLQINFWGVVHGTKAFLPQLQKRPEATLVNVSSVFGLMGVPGQAAYCASKFAVRGFTEALRHDLYGSRIHVALVFPGGLRTGIVRASRSDFPVSPATRAQSAEEFERTLRTSPERAAEIILAGIRAQKRRILIGADATFIDRLARWLPDGHDALVQRPLRKSALWKELQRAGATSESKSFH